MLYVCSSPCDDATSSPVNTKTSGSGGQLVLIPDDDKRVVDSSVLGAEGISTTDHETASVTETIVNVLIAESTSVTGNAENVSMTENASATEETPVEELSMETRRYPRREHQPPIRYDDYI